MGRLVWNRPDSFASNLGSLLLMEAVGNCPSLDFDGDYWRCDKLKLGERHRPKTDSYYEG